MNEDELYFIGEAMRHARSLPVCDCARFLAGMIASLDEGHAAIAGLKTIHAGLNVSDKQLELIQLGQLTLPLELKRGGRRS